MSHQIYCTFVFAWCFNDFRQKLCWHSAESLSLSIFFLFTAMSPIISLLLCNEMFNTRSSNNNSASAFQFLLSYIRCTWEKWQRNGLHGRRKERNGIAKYHHQCLQPISCAERLKISFVNHSDRSLVCAGKEKNSFQHLIRFHNYFNMNKLQSCAAEKNYFSSQFHGLNLDIEIIDLVSFFLSFLFDIWGSVRSAISFTSPWSIYA